MNVTDIRTPVTALYGDLIDQFKEHWKAQVDGLKEKFGSSIGRVFMPPQDLTEVPIIYVDKSQIVDVLKFMKTQAGYDYNMLIDFTATDEMPREPRFDLVYNLFSINRRWRIRLKVQIEEGSSAPSIIPLWKGADWAEREIYDMFGIQFENHPDLRRIIMDERWEGHPLRKDYSIKGYQIFPTPMPIRTDLLEKD